LIQGRWKLRSSGKREKKKLGEGLEQSEIESMHMGCGGHACESNGCHNSGERLEDDQLQHSLAFFCAICSLFVRCHVFSGCCKTHLLQMDRIVGFSFFIYINYAEVNNTLNPASSSSFGSSKEAYFWYITSSSSSSSSSSSFSNISYVYKQLHVWVVDFFEWIGTQMAVAVNICVFTFQDRYCCGV
jgi:hypothetical protein